MKRKIKEKLKASALSYRPHSGAAARIKHISNLLVELEKKVKTLALDDRKELIAITDDLTKTVELQVRPVRPYNSDHKWFEDVNRHCVYVVAWEQSETDNRLPPLPQLTFTVGEIATAVSLSPTHIYQRFYNRGWILKTTLTPDTRQPEHRRYSSSCHVRSLNYGKESEKLLIELGLEDQLDKVRETWRLIK